MRKNLICILTFLILQLQMSLLFADEMESLEVKIVTENLYPLNFESNGAITGKATAIVKRILEKSKIKYSISVYPWARAYYMAQNEKNTLIYSMNRNPEREHFFQWIGQLDYEKNDAEFFKKKLNSNILVKNNFDLKKYSIAVINNDVNHEYVKSIGITKIFPVKSRKQYINMLLTDRIDLIIDSRVIINHELEQMRIPIDSIETVMSARKSKVFLAANPQTSPKIVDLLIDSYNKLVKNGEIPDFSK